MRPILATSEPRGNQQHATGRPAFRNVGVTQVGERIWLVPFMQCDLGYFDDKTRRLEPIENPFGPKVLPIELASPESPTIATPPIHAER